MREFLDVDLFREIRCRVEGGKQLVDVRHLVATKIGPPPQGASHFVEMASYLGDRGLESFDQSVQIIRVRDEMIEAERGERRVIAIRFLPQFGATGDS